jgi:hypothetical protein
VLVDELLKGTDMDETPRRNTVSAGCVCPFTFKNGDAGYSVYDESGNRVDKGRLGNQSLQEFAQSIGLSVKDFPPNPKEKK